MGGQTAFALGLGELRTPSRLGDKLMVEIDLTMQSDERIDPGCVRLKKPLGDDGLPWLRQGSHGIRRGPPAVLTIRADAPVFEPVIQVGVHVGCGFEVQRDYTIFLSPRVLEPELPVAARQEVAAPPVRAAVAPRQVQRPRAYEPVRMDPARVLPPPPPPRKRGNASPASGKDRLVLFGGSDGREPSLAMSTDLANWRDDVDSPAREAQRESLRVEYRMLQALHQQAITLLETAEKLRQLEQTLNELQQRTDELARQGITLPPESGGDAAAVTTTTLVAPVAPAPAPVAAQGAPVKTQSDDTGNWWFYGALLLALALVGAWLAWRSRQRRSPEPEFSRLPPAMVVDPQRGAELSDADELDLDVGERGVPGPGKLDVQFAETSPPPAEAGATAEPVPATGSISSQFSVAAATVDEHFEVNPVMELADIMLSFGRVKGAAQALQEFVDHNPEEALQPWIRLMEVYRMAGMREEFERVAANLNQYFNVEVQHWDSANPGTLVSKETSGGSVQREEPLPIEWPTSAKKAKSIEEMPHILEKIVTVWGSAECGPYLQALLRDNRGGLRTGFTIEVVEELLCLIDLIETSARLEAEAAAAKAKETS